MASNSQPKPFFAKRSHLWSGLSLLAVIGLALLLPQPVRAGFGDDIASFFAWIFFGFATVIGWVLTTFVGILVQIVQYNDFINAPAVVKGWVVVRDVANMFFIVILLLLAFGSVFRVEEYTYKHHLSKLLLMAVLVNFSKSVCGFFIDIAQVVMLTFVYGFKDAAAGNFLTGLHIKEMYSIAEKTAESTGSSPAGLTYLAAAALALVTISIATVVVAVYIVMFTLRIVMLWILIVVSPAAYLLSAFPGDARKYSTQWWDYFGKYVTSGPILAFFLWLSLAVMQMSQGAAGDFIEKSSVNFTDIPGAAITGIGQSEVLLSFIISIAMLIGGLWIAERLGVAGGHLAAGAIHGIQNVGGATAKLAFRAASYLPREYGKRAAYGASDMALQTIGRSRAGDYLGIGNAALKARAKLLEHREHTEEKDTRYLQYMDETDHDLIIDRARRGVMPQTEHGMHMANLSRQWKASSGQTFTAPDARQYMVQLGQLQPQLHQAEQNLEQAQQPLQQNPQFQQFRQAQEQFRQAQQFLNLNPQSTQARDRFRLAQDQLRDAQQPLQQNPQFQQYLQARDNLANLRAQEDGIHHNANEVNREYYTHMVEELMHHAGHTRDWENNDRYRDQHVGDIVEKFLFSFPHLIDVSRQAMNRTVTAPEIPQIQGQRFWREQNERQYRAWRLTEPMLIELPRTALGDQELFNDVFQGRLQQLHQRLTANSVSAQRVAAMMNSGQITPHTIKDFINIDENTHRASPAIPGEGLYQEPFRPFARMRARASARNSQFVEERWEHFTNEPPATLPNELAALLRDGNVVSAWNTARSLADVDKAKLERTHKLVEQHGLDYTEKSEEYKKAPQDYYDSEAYQRNLQTLVDSRVNRLENTDLDYVSGVRGTIRKAEAAGGGPLPEVRVAMDFSKLGLAGQGSAVRGADKERLAGMITNYLQKQGDYSNEEISAFANAVKQASQLTLVNKGRTLGSARHVLAHESAHVVGDQNPALVQQVWQALPAPEQAKVAKRIREDWGRPDMSEEDVAHEYFAEGAANASRWSAPGGVELNARGRDIVHSFEDNQKIAVAAARPAVEITPALVAGSLQAGNDRELLSALENINKTLSTVGAGLSSLRSLGDSLPQLRDVMGRVVSSTGMSTKSLVDRLKTNSREEGYASKKISELLSRYITRPT